MAAIFLPKIYLQIQALQARTRRPARAGMAGRRRPAGGGGRIFGDVSGARPDQHAGRRHGTGGTGRRRAGARRRIRRRMQRGRRRRFAGRKLSGNSCRRPGRQPRPAARRPALGQARRPAGDAGRQGRVLRFRRSGPETGQRHAADEEGYGRRRDRPRPGAHDHAYRAAGAPAGADSGGGKRRLGRRHATARRTANPQGAHS